MVTVAWLFSPHHSHTTSLSLSVSVSVSVCTSLCLLRLLRVALCGSVAYSFSLRYNNEACQNVSLSNKAGTLYQWHQLTLPPSSPVPLSLAKKQEKSAQCCVCPTVQLTSLLSPRCRSRSRSHSHSQLALSLCVCCCGNNL